MNKINERDETLMSICAATQGWSDLDPESGEPNANSFCSRLVRALYTSSSLARADGKDPPSMDFLYRLVYTYTGPARAINKMKPDCLELVAIFQKCKFKIAATGANDVINKDGGNAISTSFIHAGIGDSERLYQEEIHAAHKPNGWLWKREPYQALAKSPEWIPCGGILNMGEFKLEKSSCLKEQTRIIDKDGSLKATDDFEHISSDIESLKVGKRHIS